MKDNQAAFDFYKRAVKLDQGKTANPIYRLAWIYF